MIPIRTALAVIGALAATLRLRAQSPAPGKAAIDSIFAQYDRTDRPGCAVAVFRDERTVFARGYGMADLNQGIAIDPNTVFYIASTSKQFTALSIALLAEQGRIALDDPVRKYVPELPAYADAITIGHLLHHTSGIRDYLGLWALSGRSFADEIPAEVALDLIVRQKAADFSAGSRFSYSNSGYFLLAQIVQRASGQSLREFAERNVFRPLGMTSTHWHDDATMIVPHRAEGYEPDGKGGYRIVRTSFGLVGDGGLLTTVLDLGRYDANFYHNRLGTRGQALIDQVTTPGRLRSGEPIDYAFGLFISTHRGLRVIQHGGSFIGYRAQLARFPTEKLSVAVLCNDYTANPEALAYRVADRFLADRLAKEETAAPAPVTVSAAALDRLVGRYELMPGMIASVARSGDGLALGIGPGPLGKLTAISDSVFRSERIPGTVTFRRGADGSPGLLAAAFGMTEPGPRLPEPPVLGPGDRAAYEGRYRSEELDTWSVVESAGDGLRLRVRFARWAALAPIRKDEFAVIGAGAAIRFERDRRGAVTRYRLDAARSRNIVFRRIAEPAGGRR